MADVAPKTWNTPCLHYCSTVVYCFGSLLLTLSVTRERNGVSLLCENFATQWGSKNQHILNHQLFWEEEGIFTGKIRSCLLYSLMARSGSLGLVKGIGSGSKSTVLLPHGPFWMLSGTALLLILVEGGETFSSAVSNCRTSCFSCLHMGWIFTLWGLTERLSSALAGSRAGLG